MGKTVKKIICILIVLVFSFAFISCSNDSSDSSYEENTEYDSEYTTETEDDSYDLVALEAYRTTDFVNGKAWVEIDLGTTEKKLDCINTDGKVLFTIRPKDRVVYASPFVDDTAFLVYAIDNKVYYGSIIDTTGKELYHFTSGSSYDTSGEYILGYGDGKYIFLKHVSDIDNNYWALGSTDSQGKVIDEFKTYDNLDIDFVPFWGSNSNANAYQYWTLRRSYSNVFYELSGEKKIPTYIGGGYFVLHDSGSVESDYLYNPSKGSFMKLGDSVSLKIYGEESKGFGLTYTTYLNVVNEHVFDRLNLETGKLEEEIKINCNDNTHSGGTPYVKDGIFFYGHGYYDIYGNEVIHIQGYENKVISCSPFTDGYATLTLEGEDGYQYVTVIDSNGKPQFEPMRTDGISLTNDDGYFVSSFSGNSNVYNHLGKVVRPLPLDNSYTYIVSEGFVRATKPDSSNYLFKIPS